MIPLLPRFLTTRRLPFGPLTGPRCAWCAHPFVPTYDGLLCVSCRALLDQELAEAPTIIEVAIVPRADQAIGPVVDVALVPRKPEVSR